jgi:RNA polymerase sigma factor (sigma-70 family)
VPVEESEINKELIDRIASGDYSAFTALYDHYAELLTNYGLKFTDDVNTVRDCLHDIFVSLWVRREKLQITSSFKSYLLKSVRTSILQKTARSKKIRLIQEEREEDYEFHLHLSPEETFINNENTRQLYEEMEKLLSRLTAKQKEVIYLRYYHNLSFDEIAGHLGLSVKACYKLMNRAMTELRQSMPNVCFLLFFLLLRP